MAANDVYRKLLMVSSSDAEYALTAGFDDYMERIFDIACDIYDSCIEDYYGSYPPRSYKRHGNLEGFNLYRANDLYFSYDSMKVRFDEDNLLPYYGKNGEEVRKDVLNNVMSGLRGTGGMGSRSDGWPMDWYTSYPNQYSRYHDWTSTGSTIDEIFKDFMLNILKDTEYLRDEFIDNYL